jgi:hypothetical protein
MFGEERKGFHSLRLFDIAIGDVFLTILLSLFISYVSKLNVILTFIIVFIIGIVVHRIFCVNTKVNVMIFGKV